MAGDERPLSVDDQAKLCAAVLGLPNMLDPTARDLYVAALSRIVGNNVSFSRHPDAYHDVWSLLSTCQSIPGAVHTFVRILRAFNQDTRPMVILDELMECLYPEELLTVDERGYLLELLGGLDIGVLMVACRYACPPSWLAGIPSWSDRAAVVRELEAHTVATAGPQPVLVFADHVAHQLRTDRQKDLHRWVYDVGHRLGFSALDVSLMCERALTHLASTQSFYLVVQVRPDGVDPDRYLLSASLQQKHSAEETLHRDDEPRTISEIVAMLPELLSRAHADSLGGVENLTLEFILPRSLIGHPVDQWEIDDALPSHLGTNYPVVVRSLDRMSRRELHGRWRRRWNWLTANGHLNHPDATHWLFNDGARTPRELFANFLIDDFPVAVAMTFPPRDEASLTSDELTAALYAGIPVMLWCRDTRLADTFADKIRATLAEHGLLELLSQVLRFRRLADSGGADVPHFGHHLTLLWDDASRLPESYLRPTRLRAPR